MQLFVVQGGYKMAHFAELNDSNVVQRIVVISNDDVNSNGGDYSAQAETMVENRLGGSWKQCSYNANQRGKYPGIGWTWNESKELFQAPKPYSSWTWSDSKKDWISPVTEPTFSQCTYTIGSWTSRVMPYWDESNTRWKALFSNNEGGADDSVNHSVTDKYWDPSDTSRKNV